MPGTLGIIFTVSGLAGGIFSLTAPLFVKRWSKLRLVTSVQYLSAPLMVLIGFAPTLPLAIAGEYARSLMRTLIEPVYAAFAMEQVSDRHRATLGQALRRAVEQVEDAEFDMIETKPADEASPA